jgi:hypothetical protein
MIDGGALKKAAKKLGFALVASSSDSLVEAVGAMGIPVLREVQGDAGFKALEIVCPLAQDPHRPGQPLGAHLQGNKEANATPVVFRFKYGLDSLSVA